MISQFSNESHHNNPYLCGRLIYQTTNPLSQICRNNDRKGGRGGRVPSRDGKRTHDRRSGTGRGKEIKKGGGGGHNWGSDQNDAKKAEGAVTEGKEDDAIAAVGEENDPVAEEEEVVVEAKEPEPEDNTMSYDEYLAQKARPDTEAFKPLEERAVENEFAGKAAAKKETEDFLVMGGGKHPKKKGSGKKEKETLVLDFKVKSAISDDRGDRGGGGRREGGRRSDGGRNGGDRRDSGRREGRGGRDGRGGGADRGGRRDRGGRGGGGAGRGGGGGRGGARGLVDTTDDNAFPSL